MRWELTITLGLLLVAVLPTVVAEPRSEQVYGNDTRFCSEAGVAIYDAVLRGNYLEVAVANTGTRYLESVQVTVEYASGTSIEESINGINTESVADTTIAGLEGTSIDDVEAIVERCPNVTDSIEEIQVQTSDSGSGSGSAGGGGTMPSSVDFHIKDVNYWVPSWNRDGPMSETDSKISVEVSHDLAALGVYIDGIRIDTSQADHLSETSKQYTLEYRLLEEGRHNLKISGYTPEEAFVSDSKTFQVRYDPGERSPSSPPTPPDHRYTIHLNKGWNMISTPFTVDIVSLTNDCGLRPYKGETVWTYTGGTWLNPSTLENERGYYVYSPSRCTASINGQPAQIDSVRLNKGWNMISGDTDLETIQGTCTFRRYNGETIWRLDQGQWTHPTTLKPTSGYFVYAASQCELGIPSPPTPGQ